MIQSTHESESHAEEAHGTEAHSDDAHAEHVLHQMHNRPYAALYVAAFFFFMISLGVLSVLCIQYAAQAGWSPVLFRVWKASLLMYYQVDSSFLELHYGQETHIFIWMDPEVVAHDELIQGKAGWLNKTWFCNTRINLYQLVGVLYRYFSRKVFISTRFSRCK